MEQSSEKHVLEDNNLFFIQNRSGTESGSVGSVCFGPPGSGFGSISQRHGSVFHQTKIVRKTLIPTVFLLLFAFLYLKNDLNVPSKINKQKSFFIKINFLLASWRPMTKIGGLYPHPDPLVRSIDPWIRIHTKMSWIRNTDGMDYFQRFHGQIKRINYSMVFCEPVTRGRWEYRHRGRRP